MARKGDRLVWTVVIVLILLWALGMSNAEYAMGGLIHLLLVIAVVVIVIRFIQGRRIL
jgi:uncharacterized protein DUF5670